MVSVRRQVRKRAGEETSVDQDPEELDRAAPHRLRSQDTRAEAHKFEDPRGLAYSSSNTQLREVPWLPAGSLVISSIAEDVRLNPGDAQRGIVHVPSSA